MPTLDLKNRETCRWDAVALGEEQETVEDVYEPFLITQGMIARTPRGRVVLDAAYEHLGLTPPRRPGTATLFEGDAGLRRGVETRG